MQLLLRYLPSWLQVLDYCWPYLHQSATSSFYTQRETLKKPLWEEKHKINNFTVVNHAQTHWLYNLPKINIIYFNKYFSHNTFDMHTCTHTLKKFPNQEMSFVPIIILFSFRYLNYADIVTVILFTVIWKLCDVKTERKNTVVQEKTHWSYSLYYCFIKSKHNIYFCLFLSIF